MGLFDEFLEEIDVNALAESVESLDKPFEKKDVPPDVYAVELVSVAVVPHKFDNKYKGKPELTIVYKIVGDDEYEGQYIYHTQRLINMKNPSSGFFIKLANDMLNDLHSSFAVQFTNFDQYAELASSMSEELLNENATYQLNIGVNESGYKTYKVEERI